MNMNCRLYFRIEGAESELVRFNNAVPDDIKGRLKLRKEIVEGVVVSGGKSWNSKESTNQFVVSQSSDVANHIEDLLSSYTKLMPDLNEFEFQEVCLEVILRYSDPENVGGLYFNNTIISGLAKLGASLDVDEYLDLE